MGVNIVDKITSTTNEIVKKAAKLSQKKYREETGLFLAEGEKAIKGLLQTEFKLVELFLKDEIDIKCDKLHLVNVAVLSKISTTKTPCGAIGVFKQKTYKLNYFIDAKRLLLLENIKDAGNLGTILRACKAFEIEGVLLLGDAIDLYNPKVVRASVGCFDLPVINIDYEDLLKFKNQTIYSTALYKDSTPLNKIKFKTPFIVAFGSEADGLTNNFLKNKTKNIKVETSNKVESLNLASAVSICLYEIYTQNNNQL